MKRITASKSVEPLSRAEQAKCAKVSKMVMKAYINMIELSEIGGKEIGI